MSIIVQKFGGTSVADVARIREVARHVEKEVKIGNQVVVVVSAMAGTTNQLVDWVSEVNTCHDFEEYDVILSTGEQVTSGLLALSLQNIGIKARSWMSRQIPLETDSTHGKARIIDIDTEVIKKSLQSGSVAVIPGFQGKV